MTPREFKAWFDGFTECMTGRPTDKQWKRICKRVREIDGEPISQRVYIDRYYEPWRRWYGAYCSSSPQEMATTAGTQWATQLEQHQFKTADSRTRNLSQWSGETAISAMNLAGKAEFANL